MSAGAMNRLDFTGFNFGQGTILVIPIACIRMNATDGLPVILIDKIGGHVG